jgi:DNA-binding MarR family transcriptional regulator
MSHLYANVYVRAASHAREGRTDWRTETPYVKSYIRQSNLVEDAIILPNLRGEEGPVEKVRLETEELYGLLLPRRFAIYKLLEPGKKLYASQIGEELKLDRKLVSFHLAWLQEHGFVKSSFGLANPSNVAPKAVRYYESTGKGKQLLAVLRELMKPP